MAGLLYCLLLSSMMLTVAASSFEDCWSGKQDIVMIIDGSGSIGFDNYILVKAYVKGYINKTSVNDGKVRIGIVLFSYRAQIIFKLNTLDKASDMLEAVDNMDYPRSMTNTAAGLRSAREELFIESEGDRPEVPNIALLIVDGYSNVNVDTTIPEATLLKETGCRVVGVSIGAAAKEELDKMVSLPLNENRIDVDDFSSLSSIIPNTLTASCVEESFNGTMKITFDVSTEVTSSFTTTLTLTRANKCRACCEVKDMKELKDTFEKTLKDLRLPKNKMSKQRRAKKSVHDGSHKAMGGVFSFLFLFPFLFFVGFDLLDAIRYLCREKNRRY